MYLVIANIEPLDGEQFIVLNVYDHTQLIDKTIRKFEDYAGVADLIQDELYVLDQTHFEVWTSDSQLYGHLLNVPGIAVTVKHRSQTGETVRTLVEDAEYLREVYDLVPPPEYPPMPKWREWLYMKALLIANYIGGKKYGI